MADVQLEHGYLRIANLLAEAIVYASFNGTQAKIVGVIIRLTYGWQQPNVYASHKDIAERCNVALTGGFRRALDELLREGVIIEVERASGRTPAAYMLNKDFENWGRFSVAAKILERLYSTRPEFRRTAKVSPDIPRPADAAASYVYYARSGRRMKIGFSTDPWRRVDGMRTARPDFVLVAVEVGDRQLERERHAQFDDARIGDREWFRCTPALLDHIASTHRATPPQLGHSDPIGAQEVPHWGTVALHKSFAEDDIAGRKDSNHAVTTTTAGAKIDRIKVVVAANTGLAAHPKRSQPIPRIMPNAGSTVEAVEELETAGVPTEFACSAIYEIGKAHRSDTEIKSLRYFVPGTLRRWEESKAAQAMVDTMRPAALPTNERRRPTFEDREAERKQERTDELEKARLSRVYVAERKAAVDDWARVNPEQYATIVADVKKEMGEVGPLSSSLVDGLIAMQAAETMGFPSLGDWTEMYRPAAAS